MLLKEIGKGTAMGLDRYHKWTCPCCEEVNSFAGRPDGECCWECGTPMPAHIAAAVMPVEPAKTEEQLMNEAAEKALKTAQALFPVLVSKLEAETHYKLFEIVKATCKKHGFLFAKRFTSMIIEDARFEKVVRLMSPAQKSGQW